MNRLVSELGHWDNYLGVIRSRTIRNVVLKKGSMRFKVWLAWLGPLMLALNYSSAANARHLESLPDLSYSTALEYLKTLSPVLACLVAGGVIVVWRGDFLMKQQFPSAPPPPRLRAELIVAAIPTGILLGLVSVPYIAPVGDAVLKLGWLAFTLASMVYSFLIWSTIRLIHCGVVLRKPPGQLAGDPNAGWLWYYFFAAAFCSILAIVFLDVLIRGIT